MNKRTTRLLLDMLLSISLSVIIFIVILHGLQQFEYLSVAISLIPLIWLSLRHGIPATIVASAISGVLITYVNGQSQSLVSWMVPMLAVGVAGLFAKYTQKTLNNRRLSSTYLNIVTACLLAMIAVLVIKYLVIDGLLLQLHHMSWLQADFWIQVAIAWVISSIILMLMAKLAPNLLIPKRSKFLSRKETSSLLND